jgi:hypothetical protein
MVTPKSGTADLSLENGKFRRDCDFDRKQAELEKE